MKNDLLEKVALTDILSEQTKERTENDSEATPINENDFDAQPIHEDEPKGKDIPHEEEEDDEEHEEFDAEDSADSAIDILDVVQQSVFTPVVFLKLIKRFGGKDVINEIKGSFIKKTNGSELTEIEEKNALRYEVFDEKLRELRSEIPFTEVDISALKPSTIKYCQKKGIEVNEHLALGAGLVKVLSGRLINIMMI